MLPSQQCIHVWYWGSRYSVGSLSVCGNEVYLLRTGAETVASDAIIPTVLQKLARKLSHSSYKCCYCEFV